MPQEPMDTVEIENPNNPGHKIIINRVDYNPDVHKLYEEPEAAAEVEGDDEEDDKEAK